MPTLLLEIGCEELPASACREAAEQLPSLCDQHLWRAPTQVYVGPRRIAFHVEDMPEVDVAQWIKGPPVSVAFDAEGRPTKAAQGFARRHSQDVTELEERDGFLGALVAPKPLAERLAAIVQGFVFAKSMRWGPDLRFARPVRWLLAKLDTETVSLPVEGIPSGSATYGHRFLTGEIEIPNAGAYTSALRAADVEPEAEARRRSIVEQLDEIGGWTDPAGVLEEVVYLAEWPVVLEGSFDERFLELPERVIQTAMQSHQRYFPLGGARFAFVANGGDSAVVRAGNDRVLEGRLEDASFTFERDVVAGMEELSGRLAVITFVAGAGSFADKTARLERLVEALGGGEATREAARLAKADQAAELVREFPDLEGAIGAEYARLAGYPEAVCVAIEEQYLPDAAGGPLPQTEGGRILAAADKIDTLTVAFALGQRPTGSRDPYALRRAAIGLCRLAVEGGLEIDLGPLVKEVATLLAEQGAEVRDDPSDVNEFVLERLEGMLNVPVEFVRAARASAVSDLGGIARLAETLAAHADSETFASVCTAYDRANRLAGKASDAASAFDPSLALEPAEIELAEVLAACCPRIETAVGAGSFVAALEAAAKLGPPVDRFFDEVLVMAEDAQVRANRLRLLLDVRDAIGALGDLSLIPR